MREVIFKLSKNPNKKYDAVVDGKTVSFGAKGYSDYLHHKDPQRKQNYIDRHRANEDWNDLTKAGTWSRYILWGETTLRESLKKMEERFHIKIKIM